MILSHPKSEFLYLARSYGFNYPSYTPKLKRQRDLIYESCLEAIVNALHKTLIGSSIELEPELLSTLGSRYSFKNWNDNMIRKIFQKIKEKQPKSIKNSKLGDVLRVAYRIPLEFKIGTVNVNRIPRSKGITISSSVFYLDEEKSHDIIRSTFYIIKNSDSYIFKRLSE